MITPPEQHSVCMYINVCVYVYVDRWTDRQTDVDKCGHIYILIITLKDKPMVHRLTHVIIFLYQAKQKI